MFRQLGEGSPESRSLAKQICIIADPVQPGDDEIRFLFPSRPG